MQQISNKLWMQIETTTLFYLQLKMNAKHKPSQI